MRGNRIGMPLISSLMSLLAAGQLLVGRVEANGSLAAGTLAFPAGHASGVSGAAGLAAPTMGSTAYGGELDAAVPSLKGTLLGLGAGPDILAVTGMEVSSPQEAPQDPPGGQNEIVPLPVEEMANYSVADLLSDRPVVFSGVAEGDRDGVYERYEGALTLNPDRSWSMRYSLICRGEGCEGFTIEDKGNAIDLGPDILWGEHVQLYLVSKSPGEGLSLPEWAIFVDKQGPNRLALIDLWHGVNLIFTRQPDFYAPVESTR